ncbi:DoxX family protein [Formosa haliotis]|uniref:DoxX family protein n=1 Tax=Formosa haliotis TaxID=1555194 RepID=UPI0008247F61|nr:DoxX family protein [Formosa haliotis]
METIKTLNKWANVNTALPIDMLRIGLGVFLFIKGINFMTSSQILVDLLTPFQNWGGSMLILHYVAPALFIGGLLIIFGLLTRWASLAQIPILIGAIAINFFGEIHLLDLAIATITLFISLFFLIYGSGKNSADYYFKKQQ